MKTLFMNHWKSICRVLCFLCICIPVSRQQLAAQAVNSFYFMDNIPNRLNLNPALQPTRGFFNIPILGGIGASVVTNSMSIDNFTDILDEENEFLSDDFINKLEDRNYANIDATINVLSFGFYAGKGFWNFDIGARFMINASIPKSMFEFAKNANQDLFAGIAAGKDIEYRIKDMQFNVDAFAQVGIGYSRSINEKLTVGGKIKVLVGLGNVNAKIDEMSLKAHPDLATPQNSYWNVTTRGRVDASLKGLEFTYSNEDNYTDENNKGYIDGVDFDSPGIGGYGFGIDLGASYELLPDLTFSAAVLDLGFINWNKSATTSAIANGEHTYTPTDIADGNWGNIESNPGSEIFDFDLLQFNEEHGKSRHTSLRPTLNIGAEYTFFNKKLGIGLLSSTRFLKPEAYSELTASVNYRPKNWFSGTLSYSFLHSEFKTFGLGLKFGPIFVASDYMLLKNFKSANKVNAYVGISIPMGKRKSTPSSEENPESM